MGQKFDHIRYASFYCSTVHEHFFMNIIDQSFIFKKKMFIINTNQIKTQKVELQYKS